MDALKLALADRQAKANKIVADTGQKWVKRSVLEQQRQDAFFEEKRLAEEKAQLEDDARTEMFVEHINRNRKDEVREEINNDHLEIDEALLNDDEAEPPVGVSETMDTLREMAQPITLFGETAMMRYRRLYLLQKEMSEGKAHPDEILLDQVHIGQQQALVDSKEASYGGRHAAAEPDEPDEEEEDAGKQGEDEDKGDSEDEAEDKGDSEDEAEVPEDLRLKAAPHADAGVADKDAFKPPEEPEDLWGGRDVTAALMDRCDQIRTWVRKVTKEWEKELSGRDDEVKLKPAHKTEMNQHRQCRRDVKPLQKRLRVYALEDFKLDKIFDIVDNAERREYRQSAELYLDLTIGKAAWPVGIGCGGSMLMEDAIGLHEKFNRMDNVKDIAWVLNDEVTRKYVQSLKRLITVAQRYWPPEDISKAST